MPIPFLNSIKLNKNQVEDFCVFNYSGDPTLSSGADFGYLWLNTSATPKVLKFWDGTNYRTLIDSTTISSSTAGTANDLSGGVAGSLPYQQGVGDTTFLGIGSSGYILTSTGSAPQWSASIPSTSVSGLAASATTDTTNASNISSGTLGLARLALASGQFYVGDASNNPAATAKSSIPLSGFGAAGADVAMGGYKITGLADPAAATDAATRGYVDSVAQGLDVKASCLVATTADITLASPGAVTIDGIYSATDFTAGTTRILVKDQSAPAENGIYIWQGPSSAMTRSADANTWDELVGAFTFIERGTANADSGWVCTVNAGGTLGTTAVTFVKFSQAGSYTAGNGIVQSGTSFNFAQSSAYTAGRIPFASSTTAMGFSANLHWDNANNRLGIGTATPGATLDVTSNTNGQNRLLLNNPSTGSGAYVSLDFTAGTSNNQILSIGSGYSGSFPYSTGALVIRSNNVNGIVINTSGSAAPITFGINDSTAMTLNGTGLGVGAVPSGYKLQVENASADCLAQFKSGTANVGMVFDYSNSYGFSVLRKAGSDKWIYGVVNESSATPGFRLQAGDGSVPLYVQYAGNVGIGITTPQAKLHVSGAGIFSSQVLNGAGQIGWVNAKFTDWSDGNAIYISALQAGGGKWISGDGRYWDGGLWRSTTTTSTAISLDSGTIKFFTNSGLTANADFYPTERLRIDSAGNMGLGVTPKSWATYKSISVGGVGAAVFGLGSSQSGVAQGCYYNNGSGTGFAYSATSQAASYYLQINGEHRWTTVSGGTVDTQISSFTQAMTLDASGNLLVGAVSASGRLHVESPSTVNTVLKNGGSGVDIRSYAGSSIGTVGTYSNHNFSLFANDTIRLTIKATGQVNFVGLASDPAGAAGDVVYNSTSNRLKYHNGTAWVNTGTNKYSGALAGTGTSFTVTHNLGTRDVTVAVRKSGSTYDQVFTDVQMTDTNTVTIIFASSVTGSDYTVTVIG